MKIQFINYLAMPRNMQTTDFKFGPKPYERTGIERSGKCVDP